MPLPPLRPLCCSTDCLPDCGSWSVALMLGQLVDCHRHLSAAMTTAAAAAGGGAAAATILTHCSGSIAGTATGTGTRTGNNDNTLPGRQYAQVERGINSRPAFGRGRGREGRWKSQRLQTLTAEYKWRHLHLRYATYSAALLPLFRHLASCAIKKCHCQQKQPCHEDGRGTHTHTQSAGR